MKKYFVILGLILALTIGGASKANATCQHTQRTLSELVYLKYYDVLPKGLNQLGDTVMIDFDLNWYPMFVDSVRFYQEYGLVVDSNYNTETQAGYIDEEYTDVASSKFNILSNSKEYLAVYSRGAITLNLDNENLPDTTWSFFILDTNKVYYTEEDIDTNLVNFRAKMDEVKSIFGSFKIVPVSKSSNPRSYDLVFDKIVNIGEAVNCLNQYQSYVTQEIAIHFYYYMPLSVEKQNSEKLLLVIHPNPATNELRIHLPEIVSESYTLEIYNLAGNAIITQLIPNQGTDYTLNISTLPKGVYFINLSGYTAKFIKE